MNSPTFMAMTSLPSPDARAGSPVAERLGAQRVRPNSFGLERGPGARHIAGMPQRRPPELDMTIHGEFVSPPRAPISSRILAWAIVVAVLAGALSLAAFALWLALLILPVVFGAAVVAWVAFRYRVWRAQRLMAGRSSVWRR
jgi:hypothetical protein